MAVVEALITGRESKTPSEATSDSVGQYFAIVDIDDPDFPGVTSALSDFIGQEGSVVGYAVDAYRGKQPLNRSINQGAFLVLEKIEDINARLLVAFVSASEKAVVSDRCRLVYHVDVEILRDARPQNIKSSDLRKVTVVECPLF
jgi:hypothetical protein